MQARCEAGTTWAFRLCSWHRVGERSFPTHFADAADDVWIHAYRSKLAYDIAEHRKVPHPFRAEEHRAGKDWLTGFLKRHQEISIRNPEPTSMSRAISFNKPNVDKFFAIYREELVKEQYTAMHIRNVDETGITRYCCSQTCKDFGQAWSKAGGKNHQR